MKVINDIQEHILQLAIGLSKKSQEEQTNFFHYIKGLIASESKIFHAKQLEISEDRLIEKISNQVKETALSEIATLTKEVKTLKEILSLHIKLSKVEIDKVNEYLSSKEELPKSHEENTEESHEENFA